MDPFSAEGELVNIHNAFHQGQFQEVVDFDTSPFSEENKLPARVLQLRARIQLGQAPEVLKEIKGQDGSSPDLAAVKVFAQHAVNAEDEKAKNAAVELSTSQAENLTVQLLCGIVLANVGMKEEALALLAKHQGSLDAVAIIVQIHLSQNRLDLAQQEVKRARSWAQDNLLVNIAESWVGLREGGEKYQAAFYVFEELATAPSTVSTQSVLSQAICELHLGRQPEAEAAMQQALTRSPKDADVLVNAVVLNTIAGKNTEAEQFREQLVAADKTHMFLQDLEKKRELFAAAKAKYSPKFEIEA